MEAAATELLSPTFDERDNLAGRLLTSRLTAFSLERFHFLRLSLRHGKSFPSVRFAEGYLFGECA
jgi:hypothetical protein